MTNPMVNIVEFGHVAGLLDRLSSPAIVDRAHHSATLSRAVVRDTQGQLPYGLEAQAVECVARAIGDHKRGIHVAEAFDCGAYNAYSRYVLCSPDLETAVARQGGPFRSSAPALRSCLSKAVTGC